MTRTPDSHRTLAASAVLASGAALGLTALGLTALAPPVSAAPIGAADAHRYGRALFAVDGVATHDAWAVGLTPADRAAIWHWDGSQWEQSKHPGSSGPSVFSGVAARTADDAWAVGGEDLQSGIAVAYAQHWNGTRWHRVPADPGLFTSEANAVAARTANDAWIVGDAQKTASGYLVALIEHWNGTKWTSVTGASTGQGCDVSLTAVSAIADDDAWAVGTQACDGGATALVEHWDGTQWSKVDVPGPRGADFAGLEGVTAVGPSDVWAVGRYSQAQQPGKNLSLHWDGTTWTKVAAPNPGSASCDHGLSAVSGSSSDDVWASSTRSCADGVTPEMLHWDGSRWSDVAIPATGFDSPAGDGLFGVVSLSKRSALTVGIAKTSGKSVEVGFIERWNGSRWALQ